MATKSRRAFTIVELMMVVGIIAVLMTIVTTAAGSAIRGARSQKADALVQMVQVGLETYYAQKEDWPGAFGSKVRNGIQSNISGDDDNYLLSDSEADECIAEMVKESVKGNPLLDVTGLFVCRSENANSSQAVGMDFMDAVRGTKRSPKKMKVAEMAFGYPNASDGKFRRFKIVYSIPADSITVGKKDN